MTSKARSLADLGNVYDDGALSNRNLIINGAMQVAQRGTNFTNTTGFQLDRWFVANPGTNTVSQVFDTTLNMYCLSVTQSVGFGTVYKVEDKDVKHLKAGDVVTLSYWINVTSGDFKVSTTATSQVSVSTTTIDTATGWYRRSASYTLTSAEVAAITGGSYLQINIEPSATSYKLTGVQLEVGDTATPFEHRSFGQELALCQRYFEQKLYTHTTYERIVTAFVPGTSTSVGLHSVFPFSPKRTAPTITLSAAGTFRQNGANVADNVAASVGAGTIGRNTFNLIADGNSRNSGMAGWISRENAETCFINIDAEL